MLVRLREYCGFYSSSQKTSTCIWLWMFGNINVTNRNFKLYLEYVLFNVNHLYLNHNLQGSKNTTLVVTQDIIYYLALHTRFSSVFYSTQLVDMFSYELPLVNSLITSQDSLPSFNSVVVYNFHNLTSQDRFFFFSVNSYSSLSNYNLASIAELYPNSNWLEREVSELHGIIFSGKKDLRNLMLQYGDTSAPFLKSYPSIGLKEVFYDSINDLIVQLPISVQL